jgi:hypothetical protein
MASRMILLTFRLICCLLLIFVACSFVNSRAQVPESSSKSASPSRQKASAEPVSEDEYHEDFSSLSLQGSRFFPLAPALGQVDDYPQNSFVRERWQLMWRPADPIDLFICKPRGVTKPPVILYLYTYPSSTDRFKSDDWCGITTTSGFAAVGFVSSYTGHRLEMRSPKATFFTDFQESIGATVHDVQMILNYLDNRGDLDMKRVGMYGQGSGGTIAILASAVDPRIKALDVLTPWGDWPHFFAQTRYVAPEQRARFSSPDFLAGIAALEPLTWLPKVKARSVRVQDVRKSGPMPDESQVRLEAVAPETALIDEYGDPAAHVPHATGAGFVWLRTELQPDARPQAALEPAERIHVYPALGANPLPPLGPQTKN